MKVFGSIPRALQVRATITAGCSPRPSAIAEVASDPNTKAATTRCSVWMFIAALLIEGPPFRDRMALTVLAAAWSVCAYSYFAGYGMPAMFTRIL